VLSLSLVSGALPTATSGAPNLSLDPMLRAHPTLQYFAQVEPDKKARVIVQMTSAPTAHQDQDAFAHSVNGDLRDAFPIINALVMDIKFKDIASLAALPNVRYVSPDGSTRRKSIDDHALQNTFDAAADVPAVWNNIDGLQATGAGVTVAIPDSGVNTDVPDFHRCSSGSSGDPKQCPSVVTTVTVHDHVDNGQDQRVKDRESHGTHVAGIIDGLSPDGTHIAPDADILSQAIADDSGSAQESDLLRGLQWIYDHRVEGQIRAVNISMSASVPPATPPARWMQPSSSCGRAAWRSSPPPATTAMTRTPPGTRRATIRL
jgi:subtilisin family serine protease